MDRDFKHMFARTMIISGAVVVPLGLILCSLFAGIRGFVGAVAGFAVASLNSVAVFKILDWALKKPPQVLPGLLTASYFARLLVLAGILWGFHFVESLHMISLLGCFLALYLAHSAVEMFSAWKSLGAKLREGNRSRG